MQIPDEAVVLAIYEEGSNKPKDMWLLQCDSCDWFATVVAEIGELCPVCKKGTLRKITIDIIEAAAKETR